MIFFGQTLETILECGYLGNELPDGYCREEAERHVEEGVLELEHGNYRLTEFGRESLLDWFQLKYDFD